jgi:peptidoglycan/LPS O-acetylase OafA/YrhL
MIVSVIDLVKLQQQRFVVLDGMRGTAALMVLFYHETTALSPMGYAAVDLFFVLSGFVLAHRYGGELGNRDQRWNFAKRRLIRLYPFYFLGLVLGGIATSFLLGFSIKGWSVSTYGLALLLAPILIPLPIATPLGVFPLNGPSWSLFFEAVANSAFLGVGNRKQATVLIVLLSLPALLLSLKLWYAGGGATVDEFFGGFARVLFSFFVGVLIFRLWQSGRRPPIRINPFLVCFVLVGLYSYRPVHEIRYDALLITVVQPFLIWLGASSLASGGSARILSWLGDISYGVYVLHIPIFIGVALVAGDIKVLDAYLGVSIEPEKLWGSSLSSWPLVLIALPATLLASHFLTFNVDLPLRRWLTKRVF